MAFLVFPFRFNYFLLSIYCSLCARDNMFRLNVNPSVVTLFSETLEVTEQRNELEIGINYKKNENLLSSLERMKLNLVGLSIFHGKYLL